jgi:septal ring factor EnvC (AmiA/AmiB activator)
MKVWKVYGSSGPRMLYWIEDGRVYVGELFAHHDLYDAYLRGKPATRREYDLKAFVPAERAEEHDYQRVLTDLRQLNDEPAQRARALEEEIRSLRIELNKARRERSAIRRSIHEEAQSAAERAAKKAKSETQRSLDEAYGSKLRSKDVKIGEMEAVIESLRNDIAVLRSQIFQEEPAPLHI